MSSNPITEQEYINTRQDLQSLAEAINEDKVVEPRIGDGYKSVPMVIREIEQNGNQLLNQLDSDVGSKMLEIQVIKEAAILAADRAEAASTSSGITNPVAISSANLAVSSGHYFTSGNTPTAEEYAVVVTRGSKGNLDWIWQAAAKEGITYTRECALADLAATPWESPKDSQIVIEDGRTQRQFNQYLDDRKAGSYFDVRDFGIVPLENVMALTSAEVNSLPDQAPAIYAIIESLPVPFTLYIPFGVKWSKNYVKPSPPPPEGTPEKVYYMGNTLYETLPDGGRIIDDSGFEDRYTNKFFQTATYVWQKTKTLDESTMVDRTGSTNGNTYNIRGPYHPAFCVETDAPQNSDGCRASIVFRANNQLKIGAHKNNKNLVETAQMGLEAVSVGTSNVGFSTYGEIVKAGSRAVRIGMQSSVAPHSVNFNSQIVAGTSFSFGKKLRDPIGELTGVNWDDPTDVASKTAAAVAEKEAAHLIADHVTRWTQPNGHSGAFMQLWTAAGATWMRQKIDKDGVFTITTKNNAVWTLTADAIMMGHRCNVIALITTTTLNVAQSGSLVHNGSATGGLVVNLPKATTGVMFEIRVLAAHNLRIQPNAADNFSGLAAGVFKQSSTIGSVLKITAITATQWLVENKIGTWTNP